MKRRFGLAIAILSITGLAFAQDEGDALFLADLPPLLSASRLVQSQLDSPSPVTVIDHDMIRASGFTEIHDLLRLVPGFLVADWASGAPNVVNRGMGDASSGRLQVLVDGRSVYNPFNGRVDWQELPLRVDDIERIEVVREANQVTFGANAFMGVVNIITRSPATEDGVALTFTVGNRDMHEVAARINGGGEAIDWRLSLSRRGTVNFRDFASPGHIGGEEIRQDVLNSRVNYWLSNRDLISMQLGLSRGDDRVSDLGNGVGAHPRASNNLLLQLGWRRISSEDAEFSVQYYRLRRSSDERSSIWNRAHTIEVPVRQEIDIERDDLEIQQTYAWSPTLRGALGAGVRHDSVVSEHYFAGLGEVGGTQWQLFGNLAWQAGADWLVNAGAMVEKHYYTDTLTSPRLAINYTLTPRHVLRFGAGRGYRAPTTMNAESREVFAYPGGYADLGYWSYYDLEPEQVTFRELALIAQYPESGVNLDARLFWNRYENYIDDKSCILNAGRDTCTWRDASKSAVPATAPGVTQVVGSAKNYIFYNMGSARVRGAELRIDWRNPVIGRVVFGHTYLRVSAGDDVLSLAAEPDFESSAPVHTTNLLWMREFASGWSGSVGIYRVGDMLWLNDGGIQPAHRRIDLRLAKRLGGRDSSDEIALTVQNLNGPYYEFNFQDFVAERRAFVTLRLFW